VYHIVGTVIELGVAAGSVLLQFPRRNHTDDRDVMTTRRRSRQLRRRLVIRSVAPAIQRVMRFQRLPVVKEWRRWRKWSKTSGRPLDRGLSELSSQCYWRAHCLWCRFNRPRDRLSNWRRLLRSIAILHQQRATSQHWHRVMLMLELTINVVVIVTEQFRAEFLLQSMAIAVSTANASFLSR